MTVRYYGQNLRVENDTLLTGYRITNGWARTNYTYFAISLSQPIREYGYKDKEKVRYNGFWRRFNMEKNFPEITGRKIVAYFNFDTVKESELVVKVALSAVSTEELSRIYMPKLPEKALKNWQKPPERTGTMNSIILRRKELQTRKQCSTLRFIIR